MANPASLLKDARRRAGLTQSQLAHRLGITQAAVAKLERPGTNPTVGTLEDALWATGQRLRLAVVPRAPGIDETLVFEQLRLSPEERLRQLEQMYEWGHELARSGARARGELA
jgi:transcriptional regulator with XRE-family HTH domain